MRSILAGVDGTPASLGALTIAAGMAALSGAALAVAHAVDAGSAPVEIPPAAGRAPDAGRAADAGTGPPVEAGAGPVAGPGADVALVASWCARAGVELPAEVLVVEGPPAPALLDAAVAREADLVVVGTEGTVGQAGVFGSVANLLARRLDVALLVVPQGCRWRGLHEIVVGVDGSEGAAAAVELVAGLAGVASATVTAVYDCRPLSSQLAPMPTALRQRADHDLALWAAPLEDSAAVLRRVVRDEGRPAAELLAAADEVHADLVVVGAQATNRVTRQRPGSVAFAVLEHATRPTLVVPPPKP